MRARPILFGLALGLTAPAAMPAAAQTPINVRTMPVTGNVPQVCTMQRGQIRPGGLVNINGLDGDTLRILQLTDPQTLATKSARVTVAFDAVCNFPHRVRIESQNNGLWPIDARVASPTQGFASALPYRASVAWGPAGGTLYADATVRQLHEQRIDVNQATAGNLELQIELQQGASNVEVNAPVLAGAYGDTLRIFLEPR
jgi:hypothetical protein